MSRWIWLACVLGLGLAMGASAREPEPGRTDGPEGSEIGQGGYPWYRTPGQFYVEGVMGAATVDIEWEDGSLEDTDTTDMLGGVVLGYMTEDWLAFQVGYSRIMADEAIDLYTIGLRNSVDMEPFNYYFTLDAGLFSPSGGDTHFMVSPGVGAEAVLTEWLRLGLSFQRDFVFSDDTIAMSRFGARARIKF